MTQTEVGIVYVLINEAMPNLVKIGITTSQAELTNRLRALFNTSVPFPFICYAAYEVGNYKMAEKALHEVFDQHRVNPKREFFSMEPHKVKVLLRAFGIKDVTPSYGEPVGEVVDNKAAEQYIEATERKRNFTFSSVGISVGSVLHFVDDENITCVVVDDRKIRFNNAVTSLSRAALDVLKMKGKIWPAVSGPQMWMYKGQTLSELRENGFVN